MICYISIIDVLFYLSPCHHLMTLFILIDPSIPKVKSLSAQDNESFSQNKVKTNETIIKSIEPGYLPFLNPIAKVSIYPLL